MSFVATFYNNASGKNVVKKNLTTLGTANVDTTENFKIDKGATFKMARNDSLLNANYMYIPEMGRYYHISVEIEKGVFMRITGDSDGVCSFWPSIKTSQCIAYRSTSKPDVRIEDDRVFKKQKPTFVYRRVGAAFTPSNQNNYVLIVSGKGAI